MTDLTCPKCKTDKNVRSQHHGFTTDKGAILENHYACMMCHTIFGRTEVPWGYTKGEKPRYYVWRCENNGDEECSGWVWLQSSMPAEGWDKPDKEEFFEVTKEVFMELKRLKMLDE